jgi:glycosyltransferase involved in cell wall biosynthesis
MLAQFYPPTIGGEERHVRNLSIELARQGHDVHVGTLRLPNASDDALSDPAVTDPGVTVHRLDSAGLRLPMLYSDAERPMAMPLPDPILVGELKRLATAIKPDVVHAHNWIVNSYLPHKRRLGIPLVQSLHDYSQVCATKRFMRQEQVCDGPSLTRCAPCASRHYGVGLGVPVWASVRAGRPIRNRLVDRFTPVSRFVATANGLPGAEGGRHRGADGSWEVVPNFVPDNLADLAPREPDPALPAEPFLFFAGDLSAEKGILTTLAAYEALGARRPPLLMVGRRTADTPATLPEGARIEHDWTHSRVLSAFQHCLAAVLPSEWPDPCPTTVLEALAMGAPLITTHQGGIADMVTAGESALVVAAGETAQLSSAMARLVTDRELRLRLSEGGLKAAAAFTCGGVATRLGCIYEELGGEEHVS